MLKVVRKKGTANTKDKECTVANDASYSWNVQWSLDDRRGIPRKVRGSDTDRRML